MLPILLNALFPPPRLNARASTTGTPMRTTTDSKVFCAVWGDSRRATLLVSRWEAEGCPQARPRAARLLARALAHSSPRLVWQDGFLLQPHSAAGDPAGALAERRGNSGCHRSGPCVPAVSLSSRSGACIMPKYLANSLTACNKPALRGTWAEICSFFLGRTVVRKRRMPKQPRVILITGATMGIGEGLALHYAQKGVSSGRRLPGHLLQRGHASPSHNTVRPQVTLALTGRNKALLESVGKTCEAKCAAHCCRTLLRHRRLRSLSRTSTAEPPLTLRAL